jgi:hypothetical protein
VALDSAIDHDLACIFCGYNLRSLTAAGNCPECGNGVAPTLARFKSERSKIVIGQCDPAIVSEWIEGLIFVLGSFVLVTVMIWILLPMDLPRYNPSRKIALYFACTGWVLNGLGIWKVAAKDQIGDANAVNEWTVLRWCIGAYTALPAIMFLHDWIPISPLDVVFSMICGVAGLIAASLFHSRLARLASICGGQRLASTLAAFVIITPVGMIALFLLAAASEQLSSLDNLLLLPVPSYQSMVVLGVLPAGGQNLFDGGQPGPVLLFLLALTVVGFEIISVILSLRQLLKARRHMRSL